MAAELKTSMREWLTRLVTWVPGSEWLPWLVARVPGSIHTKLLAAFLTMVVLLITVGAVGAYATSRWVVIGFVVGSIGLALVLGYAISWSFIGPVKVMEMRLVGESVAAAETQQAGKVPRIGYLLPLSASSDTTRREGFRQGLRELGYAEGQNITI